MVFLARIEMNQNDVRNASYIETDAYFSQRQWSKFENDSGKIITGDSLMEE